MHKRTVLKWLHWTTALLILYFFLVEPEDVRDLGAKALATHAGVGAILGVIVGIWFLSFLKNGLISKPGPKLPPWARKTHAFGYRIIYYLLPVMVLTGAVSGFAAPYVIYAFDIIPISPGLGVRGAHKLAKEIHEIAFNTLTIVIVGHAAFHLWRHYWLRDNALRIMAPKLLYKYLK